MVDFVPFPLFDFPKLFMMICAKKDHDGQYLPILKIPRVAFIAGYTFRFDFSQEYRITKLNIHNHNPIIIYTKNTSDLFRIR